MRPLALAAFLFLPISAMAVEREWQFRVFLDGDEIGAHRFVLSRQGEERTLRSEARYQVKFLGFTAYRYVHEAQERWRGDCLQSLVSRTDDNGDPVAVDWRARGECVMSFAYWNPRMLVQSRLLNAQTGRLDAVTVSPRGEEPIDVRGRPVTAQRFRLSGRALEIDLWYAGDEWVALEAQARGGRRLRYALS